MAAGIFALFVLTRLAGAVMVGARLGGAFSTIRFINALGISFPELSRPQIGSLASAAIQAGKAGAILTGIAPPNSIAPNLVPGIQGLAPGTFRTRYGFWYDTGEHTGVGPNETSAFTSILESTSGPANLDQLQAAALSTLQKRIEMSPEAFGFEDAEDVIVEDAFVQYVIQGV